MAFKTLQLTPEGEKRLINMYRLQYSDDQIAQALGVTTKSLQSFLKRAANSLLRERCHQERILANVAVRNALFLKAIGQNYKEGKPTIIENGNVVQKGEPAQAPIPGDINAIKLWLYNNDAEQYKNVQQTQLSGPQGGDLEFIVRNKSEKELIETIVSAITEGFIDIQLPALQLPAPESQPVQSEN